MKEIDSIRQCIKDEITRVKKTLLNSTKGNAIRFFLDSIQDDIRFMIKEGFSYKQQLEIINKSSKKDIKYNTYIRYINNYIKGKKKKPVLLSNKKEENNKKFKHEAVPNVDELY